MPRTIFHIDMDSFFASVEKRDHPELRDKPVIIGADPKGGKGRGVVSTCCYIARKYGVHSAMPISKAYRLCPNAVFLRPDFSKYKTASENIMAILSSFADSFQPVSIDEAYLDVTERVEEFGTPRKLAIAIKREVSRSERLTCSIGIASNKSAAKIASDLEKPNGITEVPPGQEAEFLSSLPVGKISGIGKKTRALYEKYGIRTIGQLARANEDFLRENIGDFAVGFKYIAMGIDNRPVKPREGMESISTERTFMEDTDDEEAIVRKLRAMTKQVHQRALRHKVFFRTVGIKVRFSDFTTLTRERSLAVAVNSLESILGNVEILWREFSPPQKKVRLLGVRVSGFEKGDYVQTTLDEWISDKEEILEKNDELEQTLKD
ncbi:MAG: DNA polymerase IV [Thermoplasmata archaeon]|nr:DNA polymerase IV [Thermoplasmata archaeon]